MRRRSGLKSFPPRCLSESASPLSDPPPPAGAAHFLSADPSVSGPVPTAGRHTLSATDSRSDPRSRLPCTPAAPFNQGEPPPQLPTTGGIPFVDRVLGYTEFPCDILGCSTRLHLLQRGDDLCLAVLALAHHVFHFGRIEGVRSHPCPSTVNPLIRKIGWRARLACVM
jgi:hypothetical protein